jgi:DNA polymerase-3 subunit delta'
VYLVFDAHLLGDDAADALLKDLEEPPSYATLVLVANELGSLPETIRSRCQLVPFRRLSERAVFEWVTREAPQLDPEEARAVARVAAGRLDRARRLLDPAARARRDALVAAARSVYLDADFDPGRAMQVVLDAMREQGRAAREREQAAIENVELPAREAEQRLKRAQRGAERDELLAALEELGSWYRDLAVVAVGAVDAVAHADRLGELRSDAAQVTAGAEEASEAAREAWRVAEELHVNPALWLEALFVRLRRAVT